MNLEENTLVSHYKILSFIGKGGMGEIYTALDTKLDRKVVLKILPPEFAEDENRMDRFIREAKSASSLNHPNIITIHEIGETDGTHFIATEYILGETLHERLRQQQIDLKTTLEVVIQVASALDVAHRAGIIHRDIKPENIMIRPDGWVKLLDFGIAKLLEKKVELVNASAPTAIKHQVTVPGMVIGTPNYMSPEQAKGKEVDARSDIFSLGITIYELLTGRQAFAGENALDVIGAIIHTEPKPLKQLLPQIPPDIERIVSKTIRKDPDDRYQTARGLLTDLKDAKQGLELQNQSGRTSVSVDEKPKTLLMAAPIDNNLPPPNSSAEFGTPERVKKHNFVNAFRILILLALLGIGFLIFSFSSSNNNTPIDSSHNNAPIDSSHNNAPINTIAVLPFQNKNSDADTEYLSDGLPETIVYSLSRLPKLNLKISPTSSVVRYKGKEIDFQKIRNDLGVDAVMVGRLAQRGDVLIIDVELINLRNNKLLWGEKYERKLSAELLATQKEIAAEIVQNLGLRLTGEDEKALAKNYTENNEAYQLYLRGRFHFAKRTKKDILKGIEYFQKAIKIDPNYALAYVAISDSYNTMPGYPYMSPNEAYPRAKAAAQTALQIDPTLAEAHSALAYCLTIYDWNWAEAEKEFKTALQLNPKNSEIHFRYGYVYLLAMGRIDDSIKEIEKALELEHLSLINGAGLGTAYMYAKQNDRALEQARKTFELEPNFVTGRIWLSDIYNANGMYENAIAICKESLQKDPTSQSFLHALGYAYAKSGRRQKAYRIIKRFKDIAKTQYIQSYYVASIYTALGEREKAFDELETAYREHDWALPRLKVAYVFESLHDDPRFIELAKRLKLPY